MDSEPGEPIALPWHSEKFPWFLNMHWQTLLGLWLVEWALRVYFGWPAKTSLYGAWVLDAWSLLQAAWLWKAKRRSTPLYWFTAAFLAHLGGWYISAHYPDYTVGDLTGFLGFLEICAFIPGIFAMRLYMMRYFYDADHLNLRMNRWLTFFLSVFYFQYKFNEIARFKKQQALSVASIA